MSVFILVCTATRDKPISLAKSTPICSSLIYQNVTIYLRKQAI